VNRFKDRLKEPTTYLGLGLLAQMFNVKELLPFADPNVVTGILALVGVFMPESGNKAQPPAAAPKDPVQ